MSDPIEILDLRHVPAAQLRPLLEDEACVWDRRLQWDYTAAIETVLSYLDSRTLPGLVALHQGRAVGYVFAVVEASKAVVGDVYAFNEAGSAPSPVCETLLQHMLETLTAMPGLERVEAQLLLFASGGLAGPFHNFGFRSVQRLFMQCALGKESASPVAAPPSSLLLTPWRDDIYGEAGALIHHAYRAHVDAGINEQYRSIEGSLRFLHNIVRFPGCGAFDAGNSWQLRDRSSGVLRGLALASRVRHDAGHITQLCIAPELRGKGLGRLLLHACLRGFRRQGLALAGLTVTASNTEARRLYEAAGFTVATDFDAMVWESSE